MVDVKNKLLHERNIIFRCDNINLLKLEYSKSAKNYAFITLYIGLFILNDCDRVTKGLKISAVQILTKENAKPNI